MLPYAFMYWIIHSLSVVWIWICWLFFMLVALAHGGKARYGKEVSTQIITMPRAKLSAIERRSPLTQLVPHRDEGASHCYLIATLARRQVMSSREAQKGKREGGDVEEIGEGPRVAGGGAPGSARLRQT